MKKIFLLLLIPIVFLLFLRKKPQQQEIILPTPTTFEEKSKDGYAIIKTEPDRVTLIPNFSEKKLSREILESNNCSAGINGGFYDTQNQPLGLFVSNFQTAHKAIENALLNGFIGIGANNGTFIGHELLDMHNRIALQTGPLLIANGKPLPLAIKNDEHARRMVAAIDADSTMMFLSLYNSDSVFDGPLLRDVPTMLTEINQKELLNIVNAINLDGGSASAFYNGSTELSELTPIGSFFCIKELQ